MQMLSKIHTANTHQSQPSHGIVTAYTQHPTEDSHPVMTRVFHTEDVQQIEQLTVFNY